MKAPAQYKAFIANVTYISVLCHNIKSRYLHYLQGARSHAQYVNMGTYGKFGGCVAQVSKGSITGTANTPLG